MRYQRIIGVGVLLGCGAVAALAGSALRSERDVGPDWLNASAAWQHDPIWYDGKAEYATYEATRTIYGKVRTYEAVMITNAQRMDTATTTKAADWRGKTAVGVFKHNVREVISTENYDYKFLTTAFIRSDSMQPYKVVMSSQEDCGATYKQVVMNGNTLKGEQISYFPDEGRKAIEIDWRSTVVLQDTLTLVLRSYPFDNPPSEPVRLAVIPDLTSNHLTSTEPKMLTLKYAGIEDLTLPIGPVRAHHLRLVPIAEEDEGGDYWFASESAAPWLNILVAYRGPAGITYALKSNRRWAYWERR